MSRTGSVLYLQFLGLMVLLLALAVACDPRQKPAEHPDAYVGSAAESAQFRNV